MRRLSGILAVFLIALLGGVVGAAGSWIVLNRSLEARLAMMATATPVPPTATLVPPTATLAPLPTLTATIWPTGTPTRTPTPEPTQTPIPSLAQIIARVNPSIVTVVNDRFASGSNDSTTEELVWGSGVLIDARGYVLTNEHVAGGAKYLQVTLSNGRDAPARYVAGDSVTDLALIKVETDLPFDHLPWGDDSHLRVGDAVSVIGSPLGNLRNSVTTGIISGLNRRVYLDDKTTVEGLIQTDAAINRGNSGGALIDEDGHLVGIVTLIIRQASPGDDPLVQGIGFAIPVGEAHMLTDEWIAEDD